MRLVARIVEPEWSCVVGLPLDDVARFGGRNLANHSRIITAPLRAWTGVKVYDVTVPSVAGHLNWALEEQLAVRAGGGCFILGAHQYLGIVAQIVPQLTVLEGFVLPGQLFLQVFYGCAAGIGWHCRCAAPVMGFNITPTAGGELRGVFL